MNRGRKERSQGRKERRQGSEEDMKDLGVGV